MRKISNNLIHQTYSSKGFTLIEVMVSVAIFAIIMTVGMGALVTVTQSYRTSQQQKQVHDGLNYVLETMTREIRLGQTYFAGANPSSPNPTFVNDGTGTSIGFVSADNRGYVIFYLSQGRIFLQRSGSPTAQNGTFALTDINQIVVESASFRVIGSQSTSDQDYRQPIVWIRIKARAEGSETNTVVQSMVSQRTLDI